MRNIPEERFHNYKLSSHTMLIENVNPLDQISTEQGTRFHSFQGKILFRVLRNNYVINYLKYIEFICIYHHFKVTFSFPWKK